jgi:hypothetical protein
MWEGEAVIGMLIGVQERFDEACVTTARVAQALTIDGFARLVRVRDFVAQAVPAPLNLDQELIRCLVSHHADLVDRQYALVARLLGLHREFAQRLFDVLGAQESEAISGETTAPPANVVSLDASRTLR